MAAMDVDIDEKVVSLLHRLSDCSQDEALTIILELDILAGTNAENFKQELVRNEFCRFLTLLHQLKGNTKSPGIRLASKVFKVLGPTEIIAKCKENVTKVLSETDEELKLFYLQQLALSTTNLEGTNFLLKNNEETNDSIFKAVLRNVGDRSMSIANSASTVVHKILYFPQGLTYFLTNDGLKLFTDLLSKNAVVRFRVYQLFVDLLVENPELFAHQNVQGILHHLIQELQHDDILSRVNCLEMLSTMAASSSNCLEFLSKSGTLHELDQVFKDVEVDPLKGILLPGTIKFFGKIASRMPQKILLEHPDFINFVFQSCNEGDDMLKVLCFETIFNIASTEDGLRILYQNPEKLNRIMAIFGKIVLSALDESLKVRLLDAFTHLFMLSEASCSNESVQIREMLYQHIGKQPFDILLTCAKLPFPNIRLSALGALASVAAFSWSEQDMALTAGFLEYMLDRRTEHSKEGKELKYLVLKTIAQSASAKDNIGIDYFQQICRFVAEGPFYKEQQVAVDFENL